MFRTAAGDADTVVAMVSTRDAAACQRRSGRRVTPDVLARYWADLLDDYWAIAFLGTPPHDLVALHEGDALRALSELVQGARAEGGSLEAAAGRLPRADRQHLERLAAGVPSDYVDIEGREEGRQP